MNGIKSMDRHVILGLVLAVYSVTMYLVFGLVREPAVFLASSIPIICTAFICTGILYTAIVVSVIGIINEAIIQSIMPGTWTITLSIIGWSTEMLFAAIGITGAKMADLNKRLQEELRKRMEIERTLEVANSRLKAANSHLSDFAHIASHDLHEPLRKVTVFGDRLAARAGDALDDRSKDCLARMLGAVTRMAGLLDGLLEYARVTTTENPFVSVDMDTVAAEVLDDLEVRIGETGGKVEKGALGIVRADPLQMRQLIQNLVGNALKYHKPDVPPIVEITGDVTEDGNWYELAVRDNGIGIADKDKEKAFGIFQRLVGKGTYEGNGVGLSICRKIAERHGGTIDLQGRVGQGTVFTVSLPLGDGAAAGNLNMRTIVDGHRRTL